ncbi:MAG: hypothetical protein IT210_23135 [Armatimonadetes bacterium]|nr:hypothetical protein [Armatimonadota bacterium]
MKTLPALLSEPPSLRPFAEARRRLRWSRAVLIALRWESGRRIVIPLPLFFLEDVAQAASAAAVVWGMLAPDIKARCRAKLPESLRSCDWKALSQALKECLRELRACGPLTLVEVKDPRVGLHITIALL